MGFASRCIRQFSAQVRSRGVPYFSQGLVKIQELTERGCTATVRGESVYTLHLNWSHIDDGELIASCSCPYFEDTDNCKHLYALLFQLDLQGAGEKYAKGRGDLEIVNEQDGDDLDSYDDEPYDGFYDDDDDESPPRLQRIRPAGKKTQGQGKWLAQFAEVADLQSRGPALPAAGLPGHATDEVLSFVVDRQATLGRPGLQVCTFLQRPIADGSLGKRRLVSIGHNQLFSYRNHPDFELLQWLSLAADATSTYDHYKARGYYTLTGPACLEVLPRLAATGRFYWAEAAAARLADANLHPLSWDDGPPWQFVLKMVANDTEQQWRFQGAFRRVETGEERSLHDSVLVVADGLIMWDDCWARTDAGQHLAWVKLLRRDEEMVIPYAQREQLLERIYSLSPRPLIEWPASLQCQEESPDAQPKVRLYEPQVRYGRNDDLHVEVSFRYADVVFDALSSQLARFDAANNRVLHRNPGQEEHCLQQLTQLGFQCLTGWGNARQYVLSPKQLPKVVPLLLKEGWEVEAKGVRMRTPGEFKLNVASGVDWFELTGECEFDGVRVPLPEILLALKRGETFIRLGDGSQGMLPSEWLERLGMLTDLGDISQAELRFKPSQALVLDALLAAQPEVTFDRTFYAQRDKLQSFSGVSPLDKPRGFVGDLRPYQQAGLGWLKFLQEFQLGGCLADDMGLGKTIQVLALLEQERTRRRAKTETKRPSLVVVPRSLIFNWLEEAARFAPKLKILNFSETDRSALWGAIAEHDVVLTTYGVMLRDIAELHKVEFHYAILDEAQAIKNHGSQSAKACRLLNAAHRLAMTGTPIENHLGELWSILDFLNPGLLGRSSTFSTLMTRTGPQDQQEQEQSNRLIARAIAPFILRRTKQQVLQDLPEKTEQTIYCDLSTTERKKYNELRDYYRQSLLTTIQKQGIQKSKIHVLEALLRLRQASCHLGLLDEAQAKKSSAKLEVLFEQLDEIKAEGHKALVFSQFTSLLGIVRTHLDERNVTYEYLDGKTRDRQARVERFQSNPEVPIFLVSLKAGGRGLNLTAADYVFILDPWWNPAVEAQAVDRAHRIGQTKPVFAYRFIARDTVEEKILELQKAKQELADAIINADSSVLKNLTTDDLQMLLS